MVGYNSMKATSLEVNFYFRVNLKHNSKPHFGQAGIYNNETIDLISHSMDTYGEYALIFGQDCITEDIMMQ